MSEVPKGGSVWGDPDCTATWVRVKNVGDMVQVSNFEGYVQYFNPKSHIFPPVGYVRIDKPSILRTDTAGRDVTDLPGLWSEDDTITDLSQPFTVEWLCEIGGADCGESIAFRDAGGWLLLEFFGRLGKWWIYNQASIPKEHQPKTRGDVLAWMKVLGIVPATTKGGE